jgi:16S rRNA processing protein RimM
VAGEDLVEVGRVGRPHGIDGAFVVDRASEDEARFAIGARVWADGAPATVVLSRRVGGGRRAIKLDRPVVRGAQLTVPADALPEPEDGSYYVFRLLGLAVQEADGRELGRVAEVEPGVANDVLALDTGLRLPLVEDCVLEVDLTGGRVVVARGFADGV